MPQKISQGARAEKGFAFTELVIAAGMVAIVASGVAIGADPFESSKQARDKQRIADLAAVTNAINTYVSQTKAPDLDAGLTDFCLGTGNTQAQVGYSKLQTIRPACGLDIAEGSDVTPGSVFSTINACRYGASNSKNIDGTGWVPVNFKSVLSQEFNFRSLPGDPSELIADTMSPNANDLTFRYVCQNNAENKGGSFKHELDAVLESREYRRLMSTDGGDNNNYYEVGSSKQLLGAGTGF